ncbi:MAG: triose-phosphate isomerase [Cyclobacteriaceae bacterium]
MRKNIVAGNWKMNTSVDQGKELASEVVHMAESEINNNVEIILIPPFVHLSNVQSLIGSNSNIHLGAQNCHQNESGAFTGEVSASMIKSCGATYVTIGHSERREYFQESDDLLREKVAQVLSTGLTPIFCCGETLEIREAGNQERVVGDQVERALFSLGEEEIKNVVIAYEPVWAIGTGKTASADQAQEMHAFIRSKIAAKYSQETANSISILYGGSVKPDNAKEIFSNADVDGGLIGGASLKARDFIAIAKAFD